jgi:hypothetical protein
VKEKAKAKAREREREVGNGWIDREFVGGERGFERFGEE